MMRAFRSAEPLAALAGAVALVFGLCPLAWLGFRTIQSSRNSPELSGLEYSALRTELDTLLAVQLPTPVVRLEGDTLVVLADSSLLPTVQEGGLVYSQVDRFNRFQRWRALEAQGSRERYDSLTTRNPSIFRLRPTAGGGYRLQRRSSTSALRVASPFEASQPLTILSRSSVKALGFVGKERTLPLLPEAEVPVLVDRQPRMCRVQAQLPAATPDTTLAIWCITTQGQAIAKAPQVLVRPAGDSAGVTPKLGDMPVDTELVVADSTRWIRPGQLLAIRPLEPLLLSQLWTDPILSSQWVNGRRRRVVAPDARLTLPFHLLGAADQFAPRGRGDAVRLSLDVPMTRMVHDSLGAFIARLDLPVDFASVLLADVRTGQVLAFTEAGGSEGFERIRSFEPTQLGSAVKPLLSAAILSQRPDLGSLEIQPRFGQIDNAVGAPVRFRNDQHCSSGTSARIDLEYFLRCSDNYYAVSLLFHSLAPRNTNKVPLRPGAEVATDVLLNSAPALGLLDLYDVHSDEIALALKSRPASNWAGARTDDQRPLTIPRSLYPQNSSPVLIAGGTRGTPTMLLASFAFGAWLHRWTLPGAVEAYTRVLTDRRVTLHFTADGDTAGPDPWPMLSRQGWYPMYVRGLERVGIDGTARGVTDLVRRQLGPGIRFVSKTGTLDEPKVDLWVKSYLFGIGKSRGTPALECGVTGIVYFRFVERPGKGPSLPSYQLRFFRESLLPALASQWDRLVSCP